MKTQKRAEFPGLYRVWLAEYDGPRPRHASDVPHGARAVEPADGECRTAAAAEEFVDGFNRTRRNDRLWAVAVPIMIRIDGEPRRGQVLRRRTADRAETARLCGGGRRKNPSRVCQKSTLDGLKPRGSF
jgi:hypothetical protein